MKKSLNRFNLRVPKYSYIFGFLQADGHMSQTTRNRGKISLELSTKDEKLIYKFQKLLPVKSTIRYRIRNTNYSKNYNSIVLNIHDLKFRTKVNEWGLPYGSKSKIISTPSCDYSERDYWRGLIDADGSVGIAKNNNTFISLTTNSDDIAKAFYKLIFRVCNKQYYFKRNKRDNIYNITIFRKYAAVLCEYLYYPGCLSLKRKYKLAQKIISFQYLK